MPASCSLQKSYFSGLHAAIFLPALDLCTPVPNNRLQRLAPGEVDAVAALLRRLNHSSQDMSASLLAQSRCVRRGVGVG